MFLIKNSCKSIMLAGLSLVGLTADAGKTSAAEAMNPVAPFQLASNAKQVLTPPKADKYGFSNGSKKLTFTEKKGFNLTLNGRYAGHIIASFRTDGAVNCNTKNMTAPKAIMDPGKKCFTYTGKIPLNHATAKTAAEYGDFKLTAQLLDDGRIAIDAEYEIAPEFKSKLKSNGVMTLWMPVSTIAGKAYVLNGKPGTFPKAVQKLQTIKNGKIKLLELAPNQPEYTMGIENLSKSHSYLGIHPNQLELRMGFKKNRIKLILDLRKRTTGTGKASSDTHAGIDFWGSGRLHVPNYAGKNYLQNPSFEAGFRYYQETGWGKQTGSDRPVHLISSTEAKFGNHSLELFAPPGIDNPGFLHTFAIPIQAGQKYTFSYYAKANKPGAALGFMCVTAKWGEFPAMPSQKLSTEWRRYSRTFTAPNRGVSILFSARYNGKDRDGATVFVDGLQMEAGETATAFQDQPVIGQLISSAGPGNFLYPDAPLNAGLVITTAKPNQSGKVKLSQEDFFGNVTDWGEKRFITDAKGQAELTVGPEQLPGPGVYVVKAEFELADGTRDTDYYRLCSIEPLRNQHKNKNIFGSIMWTYSYRSDKVLERYRALGFGSTTYGPHHKYIFDLYDKYGFTHIDHSIYTIMSREKNPLVKKLHDIDEVTPEIEKEAEEASYDIAKRHPWITNWYFSGESDIYFKIGKMGKLSEIAKLQMACYRGIKRFDPNKKVYIEGGPCNMQQQNGTRVYEEYLKASDGKVKFDGAAIHPYTGIPEQPDLDEAAAYFLNTLDKYGYGKETPVYWNEGVYYSPYEVPEWNLTTTRGYDHYRLYSISYHMGWSERLAAALVARNFLVALKYSEQVKNFNAWLMWISLDYDMTPFAVQKVVNTMGHLLGDADFAEDIRFAPDSRSYVFIDKKQRPLAAVWSYIPQVDSGSRTSPWATFHFEQPVEVFDLMGRKHTITVDGNGNITLPVTPFPMFIRGTTGSLKSFCQSMKQAKMTGSETMPVKLSARLLSEDSVEIMVHNLLSRPITATLTLAGQVRTLNLTEQETKTFKVKPPVTIARDKVIKLTMPITLAAEGTTVDHSLNLPCFAIGKRNRELTINGNLTDWDGVPAITINNYKAYRRRVGGTEQKRGYSGDFAAQYRVLWDEKHLYLAFEVRDDKFHHDPAASDRWINDSLQLFIDTMNDARARTTTGFDINDYNYDFFPNHDGTVSVLCRYVPDQQLAGGLKAPKRFTITPEIKAAIQQVKGGYNYEIAIPYYMLLPMTLQENHTCGFAFTLNDHDGGDWVKGAIHSTENKGAHMNPHLYPVMLLAKPKNPVSSAKTQPAESGKLAEN